MSRLIDHLVSRLTKELDNVRQIYEMVVQLELLNNIQTEQHSSG